MSLVRLVRVLDGLTLVFLALLAGVLLTGGWTVPLGSWPLPITRPENVLLATLPVLALRWWLCPPALPAIPPRRALALGVAGYTVVFSFITVSRHYAFGTHALDLGYYVQVLSNIAHGQGAYVSLPEMHAWGDHFSPILYLFVPLLVIFPGAVSLLVAQSVIFAWGAVAVFAIATRRLANGTLAAAFAGLYLLNPSLHGVNLRDFHPAALSIPLLLWAMASFEANRPFWLLTAVLLTLGTREDAALAVIGLGLWIALGRRRWSWGIGLTVLGFGWLFLTTGWVMPHFRGVPYPHLQRFAHLGGSMSEILLTLAIHPFQALSFLVSGDRLKYLVALVAPLGFLPLLSPLDLLPALPTIVVNLESRDPVLFHHRAQYTAFILPFLVAAAISGCRRLARWTSGATGESGFRFRPRGVMAVAVLVSLALTSRTVNDLGVNKWRLSDRQRIAYSVMARIPPNAAVSTWERFVPHMALRPKVFIFPVGLGQSDYVLLDLTAYSRRGPPDITLDRRGDAVVLKSGGLEYRYEVVTDEAQYLLLRRVPTESRRGEIFRQGRCLAREDVGRRPPLQRPPGRRQAG